MLARSKHFVVHPSSGQRSESRENLKPNISHISTHNQRKVQASMRNPSSFRKLSLDFYFYTIDTLNREG